MARPPRYDCVPPEDPRLGEGVRLFNEGTFFESHEVWESLWHDVDGTERELLQGLIQVAAACHHLKRGNAAGALELYAKGRKRLMRWVPRHVGLSLEAFLDALEGLFEHVQRGEWVAVTVTLRCEQDTPRS